MSQRLRARARELGLLDAEVAGRLGLRQARYSNYVNNEREPDLATLVKICKVLGVTSDRLFGMDADQPNPDRRQVVVERVMRSATVIETDELQTVAVMLEALVEHGRSKV